MKDFLIEAEKLSHDLTLLFGILSGDCRNETEYLDNAEKLIKEIMRAEDWELDAIFLEIFRLERHYIIH